MNNKKKERNIYSNESELDVKEKTNMYSGTPSLDMKEKINKYPNIPIENIKNTTEKYSGTSDSDITKLKLGSMKAGLEADNGNTLSKKENTKK